MIKMKAIKPAPFKSDAIYRRLAGATDRTIKLAEKEFAKTYATWDHQPEWKKVIKHSAEGIFWAYWTEDLIYLWVSGGTQGQYPIPKDGPSLLVFPSGYKAKSVPNTLLSRSGGSFGETVFMFGQVMHPGIEPRNFDKTVALYVNPWWVKWCNDAIKVGARESGHSI
jgi:hypothetical protein